MKGEEFDIYVTGSWNFVIWCHTALGYESSCNQIIVEVLRFSKIWTALSYTWDNAGHFIQVRRYRPTLPQINNEWFNWSRQLHEFSFKEHFQRRTFSVGRLCFCSKSC
ncbi:hypothetical protein Csa_019651 [Cucumis sativus]|nr:hypothetical protein Csa_019651 [Cucumis sativus]